MCVRACRSVEIDTFCLFYMQSLHLDFVQLMQTCLLVRVKNRFNPMFISSWQRDVSMAFQGQSLPGTRRVTLCAQRSQMKSCLFQETRHNKQTRAQSLQHSQILLRLCSALQSPMYSRPHRASVRASLLFFTGNFHRSLKLTLSKSK